MNDGVKKTATPAEATTENREGRVAPPSLVALAVFLTSDPDFAPTSLLHNLKHNKVLHEHNVILHHHHRRYAARAGGGASADHAAVGAIRARGAEVRLHGSSPTCRRLWQSHASSAGNSTSCRPRFFCRGARSSRPRSGMPCGRTACSSRWRGRRATPPTFSKFRPDAWSKSARKSRSESACLAVAAGIERVKTIPACEFLLIIDIVLNMTCVAETVCLTLRNCKCVCKCVAGVISPRSACFCIAINPGHPRCPPAAAANAGGSDRAAWRQRSANQDQLLGAYAWLHRRRLWRHRHQPALCGARVGSGRGRPGNAGERDRGARHPVADHLGAATGGHRKIRADPAARRQ